MKPLRNRFREAILLVGPWPIEPFYLGFLTFFMVASLYSLGEEVSHLHTTQEVLMRPFFSTVIAFLTMWQLMAMVRIFKGYQKNLALYLTILLIQSFSIWSWIVLFRALFPQIHSSFTAFLSPLPLIRFMFTLSCINAFIGLSRARLSKALAEKEEMLRIVENQSNLLLEHDESTRKQLSEFLHDKVQSSLVTACLELQAIQPTLDGASAGEISKVINALESLRSVDVRNASQTLSPAVGNADLPTSIAVMTENYAPYVKTHLTYSPALDELLDSAPEELLLGIYRITEQAFLNCAIHGKAKNFEIDIAVFDQYLVLTTRNDGNSIPEIRKSGLGTAIINSWVRTLNGTWSISNGSSGKVELEVVLPK